MHSSDAPRDKLLWEQAADDFIDFVRRVEEDESGDYLRKQLLVPTMLQHLGDITNKTILDAGCGEGVLGHELAAKGAKVTGVDASPKMIEAARKRNERCNGNLEFKIASIEDNNLFPEESFDIIVVSMVFQEMAPVEDSFSYLAKYLKKGGKMVVSVLHPAFDMNDSQRLSRGTIPQGGLKHGRWEFELFSPYSEPRRHERNYTFSSHPVAYYFRPISFYMNLFLNNNFNITGFYEPTLTVEQALEKMHVAHAYFIPRFLVIGGDKK